MPDTATSTTPAAATKSFYTFNGTVSEVSTRTNVKGAAYSVFKLSTMLRGKAAVRTVIASGKAHMALVDNLVEGGKISIRGFFERGPGKDGKQGGEYITAVGLPRAKAA
jgi:hypothetical protein